MRITAERTIEGLYREQALGLLRFALLLTGDLTTAEDLLQDTFHGLYRHRGTVQDPTRV
jgi:DNA-directed RNA polymerase specialized sigma24 family protein